MYFSRGRNKIQRPYTLPDIYKEYKKSIDEGSPYDVDYNTFVSICERFNKKLSSYILEGGLFVLPYNLGEISITGKRPKILDKKSLSVDWINSVKAGKKVYHINDHSNYFKFRFYWSKKYKHIKNKTRYRLVFTRANKRRMAEIIKSGNYNYFGA